MQVDVMSVIWLKSSVLCALESGVFGYRILPHGSAVCTAESGTGTNTGPV
jgi:hypothetical protein